MGERRDLDRDLLGKRGGNRPLRRPRSRLEDNIKIDLQEVGFRCMDGIDLVQDRDRWLTILNAVMNVLVP